MTTMRHTSRGLRLHAMPEPSRALDDRVRGALEGAIHEAFGCPCVSVGMCARSGCQLRRRAGHERAINEAMSKRSVPGCRAEDI